MWTWTFGASIMMRPLSTAGGEQAHELRDHLGLRRVVNERAFLAALHEPGAPQEVEVVRQRRAGDLELGLDVADGRFPLLADQEEEDLETRGVRERLERLDVAVARLEPGQ